MKEKVLLLFTYLNTVEAIPTGHYEGTHNMTANWEPVDDLSRGVSTMVNNLPSDLMPNNAGAGEWELTLENMEIGVANSTSFGLDEELAGLGARHVEVLEGERAAGLPEHRAAHEAGPAGDVVPRGGCRVRLRREGAAERAADPSEDGERGGMRR